MVTKILERHLETSVLHGCLQNISLGRRLAVRLNVAVALTPCALMSGNLGKKSASALQCPNPCVLGVDIDKA